MDVHKIILYSKSFKIKDDKSAETCQKRVLIFCSPPRNQFGSCRLLVWAEKERDDLGIISCCSATASSHTYYMGKWNFLGFPRLLNLHFTVKQKLDL